MSIRTFVFLICALALAASIDGLFEIERENDLKGDCSFKFIMPEKGEVEPTTLVFGNDSMEIKKLKIYGYDGKLMSGDGKTVCASDKRIKITAFRFGIKYNSNVIIDMGYPVTDEIADEDGEMETMEYLSGIVERILGIDN